MCGISVECVVRGFMGGLEVECVYYKLNVWIRGSMCGLDVECVD